MRFKLDENLPTELTDLLRDAGHDAKSVLDQGLGGASDDHIAAVCRHEGRAVVTLDTDFAEIRRFPPSAHPGIAVLRLANQSRDRILAIVRRLLLALAGDSLNGELWIVDETRVRVRT